MKSDSAGEVSLAAALDKQHGAAAASPIVGWQFWFITAAAIALFFTLRLLPTGTNLSHMDFRVDPKATNALEFCDPLNPQFIPVVAARSPVVMTVATTGPAVAGGGDVAHHPPLAAGAHDGVAGLHVAPAGRHGHVAVTDPHSFLGGDVALGVGVIERALVDGGSHDACFGQRSRDS